MTIGIGGIVIKPAGMEEMKWDMAGSAVVIGLMRLLAARKARINAVGVVGLVENMPSGTAQRPGDIVTSMSGQTIEVLNTDAEGRLVLADALSSRHRGHGVVDKDFATVPKGATPSGSSSSTASSLNSTKWTNGAANESSQLAHGSGGSRCDRLGSSK